MGRKRTTIEAALRRASIQHEYSDIQHDDHGQGSEGEYNEEHQAINKRKS